MNRIEILGRAFMDAFEGYKRCLESIRLTRMIEEQPSVAVHIPAPDVANILAALAPVAAAIYKQRTSLMVVKVGREERPAGLEEVEKTEEIFKNMKVCAEIPAIFTSQDFEVSFPERDEIKLILQQIVGGDDDG